MRRARRLTALLLCAALLLLTGYLALEAGHDCPGAECQVCRRLDACRDLLTALAPAAAVCAALRLLPAGREEKSSERECCFTTPVTLRVRLLN